MLKKIAYIFTLAIFVGSTAFAQDKVEVKDSDVILMVKIAKDDESNSKIVGNIKNSHLVNTESNTLFFLSTSKDASETAIRELENGFKGVEMKVLTLTAEEYLKKYTRN